MFSDWWMPFRTHLCGYVPTTTLHTAKHSSYPVAAHSSRLNINAAKFTADSLERIEEQTIFIWLNPRSHSAGIVAMQFIRYSKVLFGAKNVIFLIRFFVQ